MKRILLIISFIAVAGSAVAQNGYYHQVGDTVRGKCPIYHYEKDWWPPLNAIGHTDSVIGTPILMSGYMKHTTDSPLKVIGVASTWARMDISDFYNPYEDLDTNYDGSMDYVLFDATPSGLVEKARVCWTDDYLTHPKRYMELPRRGGGYYCDQMQDLTTIVPLREYYFDSAITVVDSFYLGCHVPVIVVNDSNAEGFLSYDLSHRWDNCSYVAVITNPDPNTNKCTADVPEFTYYLQNYNSWRHIPYKRFQLIFPIIEVDTTLPACPTVANARVATDGTTATVTWDSFPYYTYVELSYGPCAVPQSQWQTVTVQNLSHHTLTGLMPTACYNVKLRAYCDLSQTTTDWSTPGAFYTGADTTGSGGDDTLAIRSTLLSQLTFLAPNPATGSATVTSSFGLTQIEAFDEQGRLVQTLPASGLKATLDVSSWPRGTYLLRIHTPLGTATKKLLVQ